ncbi:M20/M25/M40 family metallo-hydrolase [Aureliella helgolandensis]|uniref:Peptidase T n=1 Tax=Aureliella helgolandensis TaxID=2527968 RepID=A0A518GCA9_9BACT|nr:M20/M25/M40 family metallo-hydrolase [Aureliella helgolandensis]QDV26234.1 Peptidase T [Aureliella helgolandensis]
MRPLNEKRAIDLVTKLMAVEGKSCEESQIASVVQQVLRDAGIPESAMSFDTAHKRTPLPGEVGNLIVKLPGNRKLPRVMLSAHLDTVPICVGCRPKRDGQVIRSALATTGLGADDRAGVAAVLVAVLETLERNEEHPPLTLCFFVQEEIGLQGSRNMTVSKLGNPAMAFNFDGGNPYKMTIGATGGERMRIKLQGLPAHAGLAPEQGASAINAASLAISSLVRAGWLGAVKKKGRSGTSNIGTVQGGVATNVVAEHVEVTAEARSHNSAFRTEIADAICSAFESAAAAVVSSNGQAVAAQIERRVDYDSFLLDADAPPVQIAKTAIESLDAEPQTAISNGGVDANWLVKHGVPTVTMGCGQRNVHTNQETLDIPDFLAACRIAMNVINHAS